MTGKERFTTIDQYIATFPAEVQAELEKVRQAIHRAAPEAEETISYAMPTFDLHDKHLVFFAAWKHHISLHPVPAGDEAFQRELAKYERGRGTVQFPLDRPIPDHFVEQIVTFLMRESPQEEG